tara:strand:- start:1064 stop:1315 length:252 start_codon:yes stop_codon:yes gene_type:complete
MASGRYFPTPELVAVRNVEPQGRAERLSKTNKEDLEKSRLRARKEGFYRHEVRGDPSFAIPAAGSTPLTPAPASHFEPRRSAA